jgi:hypothetical protein
MNEEERLAEIVSAHKTDNPACLDCWKERPCDSALLLARLAERDAEIERLREALGAEEGDDAATLIRDTIVERDHYARTTERFARDGDALAAKLAERDAEIARLRAALELLTWVGMDGEPCWCPPESWWSDHHERCVKTRAALAGGEGNDGE